MTSNKNNIAILFLAAGSSSRLGHPKQLVKINGKPLLQKMTETALASGCTPIVVVLGAYFEKIKPVVEKLPIHILENKNWESGMGSTIACGMDFLMNNFPNLDAIILMVCDQYYLSEKNISELIAVYKKNNKSIIASKYGDTIGVPALFSKNLFSDLAALNAQAGAKKIINQYTDNLAVVAFEEGVFDLDTEGDLKRLT